MRCCGAQHAGQINGLCYRLGQFAPTDIFANRCCQVILLNFKTIADGIQNNLCVSRTWWIQAAYNQLLTQFASISHVEIADQGNIFSRHNAATHIWLTELHAGTVMRTIPRVPQIQFANKFALQF